MNDNRNPLIHDDPRNTLFYARSIIVVLKEFYCLNDIPNKQPPEGINSELYTGLFSILDVIESSLCHALESLEQSHSTQKMAPPT